MSDMSTVTVRTAGAGVSTLAPRRKTPRREKGASQATALVSKILKRALQTLIVLIGVSIVAFVLVRVAPGNPAALMLPADATDEQLKTMEAYLGLDQPAVIQYFTYIGNLLQGDLGYSYTYRKDVSSLIGQTLPMTALLGLAGILLSLTVAIPLGLMAAIKKGTVLDTFAMIFALIGQSLSTVWLAVALILVFAVQLGWLPTSGSGGLLYLILPAICVASQDYALTTRMLRSGMIGALSQDYIMAARARGIPKFKVYGQYAFKNAVLPLVTVVGSQIGMVMAGSLIIETIFNWPGIGRLMAQAIASRDLQLIQSILLVSGFIYAICNLVVDAIYTVLDRRIAFD